MSVVEETTRPDESAVGEVLPILPLAAAKGRRER